MERNPQTDLVHLGERVDDLQNGFYVIQNPEEILFWNGCSYFVRFCKDQK